MAVTRKNMRRGAKGAADHKKKAACPVINKTNFVGVISRYYAFANSAVLKLKMPLSVGEAVMIVGDKTNFVQPVESISIHQVAFQKAARGEEIGLAVSNRVKKNDEVYKV